MFLVLLIINGSINKPKFNYYRTLDTKLGEKCELYQMNSKTLCKYDAI